MTESSWQSLPNGGRWPFRNSKHDSQSKGLYMTHKVQWGKVAIKIDSQSKGLYMSHRAQWGKVSIKILYMTHRVRWGKVAIKILPSIPLSDVRHILVSDAIRDNNEYLHSTLSCRSSTKRLLLQFARVCVWVCVYVCVCALYKQHNVNNYWSSDNKFCFFSFKMNIHHNHGNAIYKWVEI